MLLKSVLTLGYYDKLNLPRLFYLNRSNRPVRTRMPGSVAGGRSTTIASLCQSIAEHALRRLRLILLPPQKMNRFGSNVHVSLQTLQSLMTRNHLNLLDSPSLLGKPAACLVP